MSNRFLVAFTLFFLLVTAACSKENLQHTDCNKLREALITGNPDIVENEINKTLSGLSGSTDSKESISRLATAISTQCNINAEVVCYNCIYTKPAQSEIKVFISSPGVQKGKILDISYSSDQKFVFAGMHD